jgi:hypothetical protein
MVKVKKILIFEKVRNTNLKGSESEPLKSKKVSIYEGRETLLLGQVGPLLTPLIFRELVI